MSPWEGWYERTGHLNLSLSFVTVHVHRNRNVLLKVNITELRYV